MTASTPAAIAALKGQFNLIQVGRWGNTSRSKCESVAVSPCPGSAWRLSTPDTFGKAVLDKSQAGLSPGH